LEKDGSSDVAVYIVWSSQSGAEERNVADAAELVSDRRTQHYWDGGQQVGKAFQPLLGTPDPAWDVWMLFDRSARWDGETPPRPAWWEHQLRGMAPEQLLDADRFARKALEIEGRR
jgi:hypothetical protein